MIGLMWLRGMRHRSGRLGAAAAGIAIAVTLLASVGSFLAHARATMTRRATQNVAVDWQVEVQPGGDTRAVLDAVRSRARVATAVSFAQTSGFEATTGASTQTTGPGVALGLPDRYRDAFPLAIRDLAGAPSGVLIAQQTAANLRVVPGDVVALGRTGQAPAHVRVDGVVDLPQADSLFQKVGAPPGAQPKAPPDNVVLLPAATWHTLFDRLATTRPDLVRTQVHAQLPRSLPHDPAAAFTQVTRAAHNLEVNLAGAGLVGNNLGATLDAARSDALYAQVLFLFLGAPGAILAGLLTGAVAASAATRRRREQALLRTRGATTRTLARLALLEALAVGAAGAVVGLGAAAIIGRIAFNSATFGATRTSGITWALGAAIVGIVIAMLTIALPAWRDARAITVVGARRSTGRPTPPRWLHWGIDILLVAGAALVFWLTTRRGYNLVLAPEGTPSISVSYWALAGPALLWIGAGMLAWRVAYIALGARRGPARWVASTFSGRLADTVSASMRRQRQLIAGAVSLVALTAAFAASTAIFDETYKAQALIDARLTNGAAVSVTEPPGSAIGPDAARQIESVPGVRSVEPLQHRFAYVGADLQDLYGVRTSSIVNATKLQDAYFQGGSAAALINRLATHPDGILVSAETVHDFELAPGDHLHLRLRDVRSARLVDVTFQYLGIAKEFPTAPRDSFLVANADYVARSTGNVAVGTFLVNTDGTSPQTVATHLQRALGTGATVSDITSTRKIVGSSLTDVDLSGLTRVELDIAIALAAASAGLVLALGFAERRRTFAIVTALGAKPRQLGGFVWSEASFVVLGGLVAGAIAGWTLASMLVKVLTDVFDPPPSALSVPWAYLAGVGLVAIVAVAIAATVTLSRSRSAPVQVIREL
jgi:putative ABC transport system permease protein